MNYIKILLLLLLSVTLTSCKGNDDPVDDTIDVAAIILTGNSVELKVGESYKYTLEVRPVDATDKTLTCTTSSSAIATCNNGRIYANGVGSAEVTLKANNGVDATIYVNVIEDTPVASLGPISITHDNNIGVLSSFFIHVGLLTEDGLDVIDTFMMDVLIVNSDGITVYNETIEVEHEDFYEFPGSHWYTSIRLWTYYIDESTAIDGTMTVRVYKDDLYDFTSTPVTIEDGLPILTETTITNTLPETIDTLDNEATVLASARIDTITTKVYHLEGSLNVNLELKISGVKTFDYNGDDTYTSIITVSLYDDTNTLIDTLELELTGLSQGDSFTDKIIRFDDLVPGTYTITLTDTQLQILD